MSIEKGCNKNYFIELSEAKKTLKEELGEWFDNELFNDMINSSLIVTIIDNEKKYLYCNELEICRNLLFVNSNVNELELKKVGYAGTFLVRRLKITDDTYLICDRNRAVPAFVRNIILGEWSKKRVCSIARIELLGICIATTNEEIRIYLENAVYRKNKLDKIKHSVFANSGSYMGTKKELIGFIIEAIFPFSTENTVFLDIMCGSGVVSNALAQMGEVYASDAQKFCQLLAKIQGGGVMTENRARELLNAIYPKYQKNLNELRKMYTSELEYEDMIFHMDLDKKKERFESYKMFMNNFELYSSEGGCSKEIVDKIEVRKTRKDLFPYLLFTCYFSNVFFGLAQCIQLDSIRYAIDQVENEKEREWLLGVLIVVTSLIATTYGGHFAQPKKIDEDSFEKVLIQREKSAWLEFSKRAITMAIEDASYPFEVQCVDGPWENALNILDSMKPSQLIVYLDAPYTREEYSRYYHVLETMARYDYPEAEYKGRMRSKKNGERFKTEFSSKTKKNMEKAYENIILSILDKNAVCVWSFSNVGAASILNVINVVKCKSKCEVFLLSAPHKYNTQGKNCKSRTGCISVTEYIIIFKLLR